MATSTKELCLRMPWGKIRGRIFGASNPRAVLCLHGWLDNANSFEPLSRFLCDERLGYKLICVDLPGHGLSDPIPPGVHYSMSDGLIVLKRVQDALEEDLAPSCDVLAHSLGAGICGWFASTFPERVTRLAAIDFLAFSPFPLKKHGDKTRRSIEIADKLMMKHAEAIDKPEMIPSYPFEECVDRALMGNWFINGENSISRESVVLLLRRGLRETSPGQFTWRADLRLRVPSPFNMTVDQVEHLVERIECPHLVIKASESPYYFMTDDVTERITDVYRNSNQNFALKNIDGGHHVHMEKPKEIAEMVAKFFAKDFKPKNPDRDSGPMIF